MRSDEENERQTWAVLYDDGMSLTTASEQIARTLAEAERQRGCRVTIRRLDHGETPPRGLETPAAPEHVPVREPVVESGPVPAPEPARASEPVPAPEPARAPEPVSEAPPAGLTREPEPARIATPGRRRRLLLYLLAAVCIVVAAAVADHWNVLPRVGAGTSPAQVGLLHGPRLLPPLDQPPVPHFGQ